LLDFPDENLITIMNFPKKSGFDNDVIEIN